MAKAKIERGDIEITLVLTPAEWNNIQLALWDEARSPFPDAALARGIRGRVDAAAESAGLRGADFL